MPAMSRATSCSGVVMSERRDAGSRSSKAREVGTAAQPAGQHGPTLQSPGLAGQVDEDLLRHILGRLSVARQGPQGHAVDQPNATLHQLGERRGVALLMKPSQQF